MFDSNDEQPPGDGHPGDPRAVAALVAGTPSVQLLLGLLALDDTTLGPQALVSKLVGFQRVAAWIARLSMSTAARLNPDDGAQAALNAAIAEVADIADVDVDGYGGSRRTTAPCAEEWVRDEVAAALGVGSITAHDVLERAVALTRGPLTTAGDLLGAGLLSDAQAGALHRATQVVAAEDPDLARRVQDALLADTSVTRPDPTDPTGQARVSGLPAMTPAQIRRRARAAAARLDPDRATLAREQAARRATRVSLTHLEDSLSQLHVVGPSEDVTEIYLAVNAYAHRAARDERADQRAAAAAGTDTGTDAGTDTAPAQRRLIGQHRVDTLLTWARAALAHPDAEHLPTTHGRRRVELVVHVDLPTLLRLQQLWTDPDQPDPPDPPNEPGILTAGPDGGAILPAHIVRTLAADATWLRWVHEPVTGHLLDRGRTRYHPDQELADYVLAREATCTFPTVRREALVDRVEVRDLRRRACRSRTVKLRAA